MRPGAETRTTVRLSLSETQNITVVLEFLVIRGV